MQSVLLQSGLSFLEGVLLVFSPCILPVLPLLLASGATGNRQRPVGIIVGFVATFSVLALFSRHLFIELGIPQDTLRIVSFGLLAVFGLIMLLPFLEEKFSRATQKFASHAQKLSGKVEGDGFKGGVAIGSLIGIVWIPCAGPLLAAALLQVVQAETTMESVFVIFTFTLGAALPMFVIMDSGQWLAKKFSKYSVTLRRSMGALLVIFASFGMFGFDIGLAATAYLEQGKTAQVFAPELQKPLPETYKAPPLAEGFHWINSNPVALDDLKGKVVLVDFWTYSCINCIRTLPHLREWYSKYNARGLEIIGVHAPEFSFERKIKNVEAAVRKHNIIWPVVMDNDFATWKNYNNRYWPAHYLINKNGDVVYTHFGEGNYDVTEHNIRVLLGLLEPAKIEDKAVPFSPAQSPETYLGRKRGHAMWNRSIDSMPLHHWKMDGKWMQTSQMIQSGAAGDELMLKFTGKKVFLVMETARGTAVDVEIELTVNGKTTTRTITVQEPKLYEIVNLPEFSEGMVTITASKPTLRAYAFTFES